MVSLRSNRACLFLQISRMKIESFEIDSVIFFTKFKLRKKDSDCYDAGNVVTNTAADTAYFPGDLMVLEKDIQNIVS